MYNQRVFYATKNMLKSPTQMAEKNASSSLIKWALNTSGEAKLWHPQNPDHESHWFYATFNPGTIHEELCCYLECYDIEFVKRIAVVAGNLYQAVLGEHYPEYCYGHVFVNPDYHFYARLSAAIPNVLSLTQTFNKAISLNKDGTVDLSAIKNMTGFMSAYALCVYFADSDYDEPNLLCVGHRVVKIDPESAFSPNFFTDTFANISAEINEETLYAQDIFLNYQDQIKSALLRAIALLKVKINDEVKSAIQHCLFELLRSPRAKQEFYQTLCLAIDKTGVLAKILKTQISSSYPNQEKRLSIALVERSQKFAYVLNQLKVCEYPIKRQDLSASTEHLYQAESQNFLAKAKRYEKEYGLDAAVTVITFALTTTIFHEVDEDGTTSLLVAHYIELVKLHLSLHQLHMAFALLTTVIMQEQDASRFCLIPTESQLSWCFIKRAQLYASQGDTENEKKDLVSSLKCFNPTNDHQPIPYEGDRAVLAKFMFYQPANQPQSETALFTSLSMKSER